jgi:Fe-S cluster biogenesis protein NfuA
MTDPAGGTPARLGDDAVRARLAALNEQLARLEVTPGPVGELALLAVSGLAGVYGQALARTLELAGPAAVERLLGDELIGHLLALHGIHPEPVERRVARAIGRVRDALSHRGGSIELTGIEGGVATVRVSAAGCGPGPGGVERAVREAVLAAAPELTDVVTRSAGGAAFVPLDSLLRPAAARGPL